MKLPSTQHITPNTFVLLCTPQSMASNGLFVRSGSNSISSDANNAFTIVQAKHAWKLYTPHYSLVWIAEAPDCPVDGSEYFKLCVREVYLTQFIHFNQLVQKVDIAASMALQCGALLQGMLYHMRDNEVVVCNAVSQDGNVLQYASLRLRSNETIVWSAAYQCPKAIFYGYFEGGMDKRCPINKIVDLINLDVTIFKDLPLYFRDNVDVVMAALQYDGLLLPYVSKRLQHNKDVVVQAVWNTTHAFVYAPKAMKDEYAVAIVAVFRNGLRLYDVSSRLRHNQSILVTALLNDVEAFAHVPKDLQSCPILRRLAGFL